MKNKPPPRRRRKRPFFPIYGRAFFLPPRLRLVIVTVTPSRVALCRVAPALPARVGEVRQRFRGARCHCHSQRKHVCFTAADARGLFTRNVRQPRLKGRTGLDGLRQQSPRSHCSVTFHNPLLILALPKGPILPHPLTPIA